MADQSRVLEDCLLAMASFKNRAEAAMRLMHRHVRDEELKYMMSREILLVAATLSVEEYPRIERIAATDPAVTRTTAVALPAMSRIQQWSGLRAFRNNLLAHSPRNDDRTIADGFGRVSDGSVPDTNEGQILLAHAVALTASVFVRRHAAEYDRATGRPEFNRSPEVKAAAGKHGPRTVAELRGEYRAMADEVATL